MPGNSSLISKSIDANKYYKPNISTTKQNLRKSSLPNISEKADSCRSIQSPSPPSELEIKPTTITESIIPPLETLSNHLPSQTLH